MSENNESKPQGSLGQQDWMEVTPELLAEIGRMVEGNTGDNAAQGGGGYAFDEPVVAAEAPAVEQPEAVSITAKKAGKGGTVAKVLVGVLAGVFVLGGGGYTALRYMQQSGGPGSGQGSFAAAAPQQGDFDRGPGGFGDFGDFGDEDDQPPTFADQRDRSSLDRFGVEPNEERPPVPVPGAYEPTLLITEGNGGHTDSEAQVEPDVETQDEQTLALGEDSGKLSEEERMYDALLESSANLDVPVEAIRIDRSVIDNRLREQRVEALDQAITQTRSEVQVLSENIGMVKEETAALKEIIERNNETTLKVSKSIETIESMIAGQFKDVNAKIAKLEKQPVAVAAAPAPKPAAKPASAPKKADPPKQVASQPKQAPASKPVVKPVVPASRPVVTSAPASATCDTKKGKTSQVWRVAGATNTSAYLLRAADGFGLLVKLGTEVPGFGMVQGIDLATRTVCTTSGLVRR